MRHKDSAECKEAYKELRRSIRHGERDFRREADCFLEYFQTCMAVDDREVYAMGEQMTRWWIALLESPERARAEAGRLQAALGCLEEHCDAWYELEERVKRWAAK